jgi:hypothetical protein
MSAMFAMAQAQANATTDTLPKKKKKKKRKRSRPPSLVQVEMRTFQGSNTKNNNNTTNNNNNKNSTKTNQTSQQPRKKRKTGSKKKGKKGKKGHTTDLFANTAESLRVISDYHTLNKRIEQNNNDTTATKEERTAKRTVLLRQQKEMGGIDRYQKASIYGAKASKFVCAEWVTECLLRTTTTPGSNNDDGGSSSNNSSSSSSSSNNSNSKSSSSSPQRRPKVLDVGAIDNQYISYDWLDAVPIDLNAQHPSVTQIDFFDFAHNHIASTTHNESFDAIVMSLVLNFQGDPRRRGDMLALTAHSKMLKHNGLMFLALPSASLDNSRYCDEKTLVQICETLGYTLVENKRSAKLILFTLRLDTSKSILATQYNEQDKTFTYHTEVPRKVVREERKGEKRNNFCCMLKTSAVSK